MKTSQCLVFRVAIHRDFVNLQVEMLRQFQIQQVSYNFDIIYFFVVNLLSIAPMKGTTKKLTGCNSQSLPWIL